MNRYPLWKYIVIGFALAFGLLYTLPNFFPEAPAVQVSSSKAARPSFTCGGVRNQYKRAARPCSPLRRDDWSRYVLS